MEKLPDGRPILFPPMTSDIRLMLFLAFNDGFKAGATGDITPEKTFENFATRIEEQCESF
jgi:hypothetical protein